MTWVARLVERSRAEFELFHSLEVELAADGVEGADVDVDGEVFSLGELRDQFAGLAVPAPGEYVDVDDFGGADQFRLTCVFVLGVLGRWDEAFAHLGPFPGVFDRSDRS